MIIARRIPKDAARPATLQATRQPINEVKWPFIRVINSLFWTAQSEAKKWELQVQLIMTINHVTPIIMEINHGN